MDLADPRASPGFNPLELEGHDDAAAFRIAAEVARILRQRFSLDTLGPRTEEVTRNGIYTLATNNLTLLELPLLLTSPAFRQRLVANVSNEEVAAYWRQRFEPLSEKMKSLVREAVLNKVSEFLANPVCRHLLGQTQSTIKLAQAVQRNAKILAALVKGKLGEAAHTVGNLWFARFQSFMMSRASMPERERRIVTAFCDEVQNLAENESDLITLIGEGRKHGASLITANQFWHQLSTDLRGALLSTGTQVFFRLSATDAKTLAPELSVSGQRRWAEELTTLPRGEAIVRVGWAEPERIRIPPLPPCPPPNSPAVRALKARAMARSAVSRTEIETEIRNRRSAWVGRSARESGQNTAEVGRREGQEDW